MDGTSTAGKDLFAQSFARSPFVIHRRIVQIIMKAATLMTLERAVDNEFRHGGNVAKFKKVGSHFKIPIIFQDFLLQIGDSSFHATFLFW